MTAHSHSAAFALAFLVLACTGTAALSQTPHDYFAPRTPESQQLLGSNEGHHLPQGISNLRAGQPHQLQYAKHEFDFILGYWPNHPQVLGLMAETLTRMGKPSQMEPYFERAYQISPNAAQLYVVHGVALLRVNQVDDAIKRLQRAVELDEASMNGQYNLGLALVRAKRYDEANVHAQRAYELGHPLPGLREQLQKASAWKPAAKPAAEPAKSAQ